MAAITRWTNEQVQLLLEAVDRNETAKQGFVEAAAQLEKSVGTVQQKYYALKRKTGEGRKRPKASRKPAARSATPARKNADPDDRAGRLDMVNLAVSSMSNVELAKLIQHATSVQAKRMVDFEAQVKKLLR